MDELPKTKEERILIEKTVMAHKLLKEVQIATKSKKRTICKKGHMIRGDNLSSQGHCKICLNEALKIYAKTEKFKESRRTARTYVAKLLKIKPEQMTEELYELKLSTLKLKRKMEN